MTPGARPLVAGNWKMNGTSEALDELRAVCAKLADVDASQFDSLLCVPATLASRAADAASGSPLAVGGQDCHAKASGAHTGDVSAEMLADAGCSSVIVGHSERRTDHGECDADVLAKAEAAWRAGLAAIICVGETREEREAGRALEIVGSQLDGSIPQDMTAENSAIAYEPVWAIGTGLVPSNEDIAEMHAFIRNRLSARFGDDGKVVRILYGGSVKPGNAAEIFAIPNVDGGLIGGASLKAVDFLAICGAVTT
jgi:triosephosphate isomerase (TIM)